MNNPAILVAVSIFLADCSSLQVGDEYQAGGQPGTFIKTAGIQALVDVQVSGGLNAVGPLGIPVVPLRVGMGKKRFDVTMHYTFNKDRDFEIPVLLCLGVPADKPVCEHAAKVSVSAREVKDAADHKAKPSGLFVPVGTFDLDASNNPAGARLSRTEIYARYGYDGVPRWEFMWISVDFHFACSDQCPAYFDLPLSDILTVEGHAVATGTTRFVFTKDVTHYDSLMKP